MKLNELPTDVIEEYDWAVIFGKSEGWSPEVSIVAAGNDPDGISGPEALKECLAQYCLRGWGPEMEYHAVFSMYDGRFAYINAGCDTTGWGCMGDHASVRIENTLDELYERAVGKSLAKHLKLGKHHTISY